MTSIFDNILAPIFAYIVLLILAIFHHTRNTKEISFVTYYNPFLQSLGENATIHEQRNSSFSNSKYR